MDKEVVIFRLFLAFVFSAIIGYEREVNQSNAGLKTHILVALGSTLVALLQVEIIHFVREIAISNPDSIINVSADASRLVSNVISGIGFLGAGTIIVTKRNVSGLTTAASIWTTASISIAVGMGFYIVALAAFSFVLITLFMFNHLFNVTKNYRIIVKYVGGVETLSKISSIFEEMSLDFEIAAYKSDVFDNYIIRENVFIMHDSKESDFEEIVSKLSITDNIVSVEKTNLY
ncbi:MAG TPA: MgtC/SapB family protein [Erysipelotrichaceae bacterium]|nr:MgtC/SapB family protein [Erysipelotrichaceae bacterium]